MFLRFKSFKEIRIKKNETMKKQRIKKYFSKVLTG